MNRPFARLILFTALIAGASGSTAAFARPTKVALTKIDGDANGIGEVVVQALDDADLSIVTPGQVDRAIDRLGIDERLADRDVLRLASELDVDAVVRGAFDRRGHKMRFTIFANGKKGKPFSVEVSNAQSNKFRQLVRSTVIAKLAAAVPPDDAPSPGPQRPEKVKPDKVEKPEKPEKPDRLAVGVKKPVRPAGKSKDATDDADGPVTTTAKGAKAKPGAKAKKPDDVADDAKPGARTRGKKAADEPVAKADDFGGAQPVKPKIEEVYQPPPPAAEARPVAEVRPLAEARATEPTRLAPAKQVVAAARDDDDGAAVVQDRIEPVAVASPRRGANLAAARANLGVSAVGRSLGFEATSTAVLPRSFTSDPVAGARFEGELYPFSFNDTHGVLAGFGIAVDFDQTLSINVGPANAAATVPATERHYSVGLRYRLPFGQAPTSPTLTFGVGYATQTFTIDPAMQTALDLPSVDYQMIDPSLAVRVPLGQRFAVTAEGRALLALDAGAIEKSDQYGSAKLFGARGSLGFEVVFASRFALRLSGEVFQMNLQFDGNGALANNRDGNAQTVDVTRAVDTYFGGAATLGVMY